VPQMKIGLVLGAGGEAGVAFHRGVLRGLEERGLRPDEAEIVVGTSAGALVGAVLRADSGQSPAGSYGQEAIPARAALLDLARRPRSAVNAALLRPDVRLGRLDIRTVVERFRSTQWPDAHLWVVAARRSDGRRTVFGRPGGPQADVASAVAASCAVPGFVRPVEIDGVGYVDGGVHSPTNADVLAGCGLDLVIVSSPMSAEPRALTRLDAPIRWRFHRFLRNELWVLRPGIRQIVTLEPDRATLRAMGLSMLRTGRAPEIEEAAYALAGQRLKNLSLP